MKKPKKTKLYWTFIVLGFLLMILAIMLAPFWSQIAQDWKWCFFKNWGPSIINMIICVLLLIYIFGYLLKKIIHGRDGVIKTLTMIEFALLFMVAIGCVLSQFKILNISGACKIFGLAVWCRGIVECIRGYYYRHDDSNYKYPLWQFCLALVMVTFGTYAFAKPFISDTVLLWFFVIFLLLCAIILICYGAMAKPAESKKKKVKNSKDKDEDNDFKKDEE